MPEYLFSCHPTDIEDEGIESALGVLAGEIGVDAINVAADSNGSWVMRGKRPSGSRLVEREAGAYFQPEIARYGGTHLRPVVASRIKSRNPLEKIAQEAERLGIRLRASVACCLHERLAAKYPMARCVNVLGDPDPAWLCPANPDVREFLAAMAEDLMNGYRIDSLELRHLGFPAVALRDRGVHVGLPTDDARRPLLTWCFCSSCRQRAADLGIDVDAVLAWSRGQVEGLFRLEAVPFDRLESLLSTEPQAVQYAMMREQVVVSLAKLVRSRTTARLVLQLPSAGQSIVLHPALLDSFDRVCFRAPAGRRKAAIAGLTAVGQGEAAQLAGQAAERAASYEAGSLQPARTEVRMPCHPPEVEDGPTLVTEVHNVSQTGVAAVGFTDYGVAPAPCLEWVRQAIRFARREAE